MSPVASLFHSRKFLLLLLDSAIALIGLLVHQFVPQAADFVTAIVGILQPVFVAVIVGIAVEDAAAKNAAGKI